MLRSEFVLVILRLSSLVAFDEFELLLLVLPTYLVQHALVIFVVAAAEVRPRRHISLLRICRLRSSLEIALQ